LRCDRRVSEDQGWVWVSNLKGNRVHTALFGAPVSPARGGMEGGETSGEGGEVTVGGIAGYQQVESGGLEWRVSEEMEKVVAKERTSERGAEA